MGYDKCRYDMPGDDGGGMYPHEDGDWVAADYAAHLEQSNTELRTQLSMAVRAERVAADRCKALEADQVRLDWIDSHGCEIEVFYGPTGTEGMISWRWSDDESLRQVLDEAMAKTDDT